MFYTFDQNNSGGSFDFEEWRISQRVIVEADSAEDANERAEDIGLYFDGAWDCPCCGNRWYSAYGDDGDDLPSVYGVPVWRHYAAEPNFNMAWMGDNPETYVHYKGGTIEAWKRGEPVQVKESEK